MTQPKLTIVIDTREQQPLAFTQPSVRDTLTSGDYSLVGAETLFAVERKSIADLTNCCCGDSRQRFERELQRLRGYRFSRLVVIGDPQEVTRHRYYSQIPPQAVMASLAAWEVRYVPVVWAATPTDAASLIENWASWFAREITLEAEAIARPSTQTILKNLQAELTAWNNQKENSENKK